MGEKAVVVRHRGFVHLGHGPDQPLSGSDDDVAGRQHLGRRQGHPFQGVTGADQASADRGCLVRSGTGGVTVTIGPAVVPIAFRMLGLDQPVHRPLQMFDHPLPALRAEDRHLLRRC